jgi:hypothetical protein
LVALEIGTVNLTRQGYIEAWTRMFGSCRHGCFCPTAIGIGPKQAKRRSADEMTLYIVGVVDGGVG